MTNLFLAKPSQKKDLHKVGGVYGIVYKAKEGKSMQYIGSRLNLYERVMDHIKNRNSNTRLQRSIGFAKIWHWKI